MILKPYIRRFAVWAAVLLLAGCLQIADYSLEAYTYATELKARSLVVLDKSKGSYASHKTEADQLLTDLSVAYEFAAGIEANNDAAQMWDLIRDPNGGSIGGLIQTWRTVQPGGMSERFRQEFKKEITFGFDRLICLEVNKREDTRCPKIPEAEG